MSLSMTLLTVLSGVALLLWGLRTIKRAVLRGYGAQVQAGVAMGTKNRVFAFFSGALVTFCMQSSVATTLLTSSLFGRGLMTLSAGIAVVIGADVGSAVLAKILSFDLSWLAPLFLSVGIILHLIFDDGSRKRFAARIIMGLGFVLTGLAIISEATEPLSQSETLPLILAPLSDEPMLALLIAAAITYFMHSSLSAVLLFATLTQGGVLPLDLAITFIIGANVGAAIIPMLAVLKDTPAAVQIPLANIIMRMVTGFLIMIFLPIIIMELSSLDWDVAQKVVAMHVGFNIALAILFMPITGLLAKICAKISPAIEGKMVDETKPKYLDKKALSSPSSALSCATRETLHISEIIEEMLQESYEALANDDEAMIYQIKEQDSIIDKLHAETKHYIIHLTREELSDNEADQAMRIMNFAMNLEHCGDIIEGSLMDIALKKIKSQSQFSKAGLEEIKSIHEKVVKNLKMAQSLFLSSDPALAKQLLSYKKGLKVAENKSAKNHIKRLQEGLPQTMSTSGMHMDVIRDYRRVNTYISSIAYTSLETKKK